MYYHINHRLLIICIVYFSSDILNNEAQCLSQKFKINRLNFDFSESRYLRLKESYPTINLDLGTPNLVPPVFLRNSFSRAAKSCNSTIHQYAPEGGINELTNEIALLYSTLMHRELDATKNVLVTVGATEAIYLTVMAHTLPGDEWIVIQPSYAYYPQLLSWAQAKLRYVQLKPKNRGVVTSSADWTFDRREMTEAFNEKTKGIIVNTPHNPTGKIFTEEELRFIADLANKWDVLVLIDEVYEWYIFDSNRMIRMATLSEEIFHRSIMVNSISKSYVATGWRLGWAIGPAEIINNLRFMQSKVLNSHSYPLQVAAAEGIRRKRYDIGRQTSYTSELATESELKRDKVVDTLLRIGAQPVIAEGGFFVLANFTALESRATGIELEKDESRDVRFVNWVAKKMGILLFPGSFFFMSNEKFGEDYIRINIVMKNETIEEACRRLLDWFLQ